MAHYVPGFKVSVVCLVERCVHVRITYINEVTHICMWQLLPVLPHKLHIIDVVAFLAAYFGGGGRILVVFK